MVYFLQVWLVLALLAVAWPASLPIAQECNCDATEYKEMVTRLSLLEASVSSLKTIVFRLKQETNKMKKLTLVSLNVALTPEEDQCKQSQELYHLIEGLSIHIGVGHGSCELMGTIQYPAVSCKNLMETCQQPSGLYFVQGSASSQVYCLMDEFGGGWTRFGKGGMESTWNYRDEDETEINLDLISPQDIKMIKVSDFNTFKIFTDVEFYLQAEDSSNPSTLIALTLPSLEPKSISIGQGRDHTHLELTEEGDRLACRSGTAILTRCGEGNLPPIDKPSKPLVLISVFFGPRAVGQGADGTHGWARNRYTWSGSYYYLLAK
ncbi:echinolectin 1-like [Asterias amurensis]|uniref:echinolectin 1-like n=1 Tax=Asterias amurensis TaxID=7602 RepID=UPI003AB27354